MAEPAMAPGGEVLILLVGRSIWCFEVRGGDARAAVSALLVINEAFERELELARDIVSQ